MSVFHASTFFNHNRNLLEFIVSCKSDLCWVSALKKIPNCFTEPKIKRQPFSPKRTTHTNRERETERERKFYFLCFNCEFATLATANFFTRTCCHQRAGPLKFLLQQTWRYAWCCIVVSSFYFSYMMWLSLVYKKHWRMIKSVDAGLAASISVSYWYIYNDLSLVCLLLSWWEYRTMLL